MSHFISQHLRTGRSNVFTPTDKQEIANEIGLDNFNNLNVFIKRLREKKAIKKEVEGYSINPILIPNDKGIAFIWNNEED